MSAGRIPVSFIIRFALVVMICCPFLLELKNGMRTPLVPYNAHLILGMYIVLFACVLPLARIRVNWRKTILILGWVALSCVALTTVIGSPYPYLGLQRFLMVFATTLMLLVVVFSDRDPIRSFYSILTFMSYFGATLAAIALVIYLFGQIGVVEGHRIGILNIGPLHLTQRMFHLEPFFRVSSLTGNPNTLAIILSISLVSTLALHRVQRLSHWCFAVLTVVMVVALLFTFSRAGILFCLVSTTLLYIFSAKKPLVKCVKVIFAVAVCIGLTLIFIKLINFPLIDIFAKRLYAGLNARDEIWLPLMASISDRPLMGVGFGLSSEAILESFDLASSAHSMHLAVLSELGLAGYFILLGIWIFCIVIGLHQGVRNNLNNNVKVAFITVSALLIGWFVHQAFELYILRFGAQHWFWVYLLASIATFKGAHKSL